MNALRDNLLSLFPYTAQGAIGYRGAAASLEELAIGTAGQGLRTNNAANAPEWGNIVLDNQELTVADWTSTNVAAYQTVPNSTITLTLPVPGIIFSLVTCNLNSNNAGDFAALRTRIDGSAGDAVQTIVAVEYKECATAACLRARAAGNIDCDIQIYGEGAYKATIINAQIIALAIAGS